MSDHDPPRDPIPDLPPVVRQSSPPSDTPSLTAVTGRPTTLLRLVLKERHLQIPRAFRAQYVRAAHELAEQESDPEFRKQDVSPHQYQRWLDGQRPRPYACRIIEYMLDRPIDELLRSAGPSVEPSPLVAAIAVQEAPPSFGDRFKQLRKQSGLSFRRLAGQVHYSRSYLWNLETGGTRPTIEVASALDTALDAHGQLLAIANASTAYAPSEVASEVYPPISGEEGHDVRRRHFIRTLTGLALSTPPLVGLEILRQGLGHAIGNDRDQWNRITADYAQSYYTTPPDVLCERLGVDIGILQQLLASCPNDRDLARAAANQSMVLAITLTSVGQTWMARRWWRTARDAADKSGDLGVRVMTRSQEAVKGLYDGSPLSSVLTLADETMTLAGRRVCPGVAGVIAGRAQALAISGRREEAADAVRAVEAITAKMPATDLADESMFGWPEHRLRHTESFVYTEIGDTKRAMVAQDIALRLYPDSHAGNRAMVQMHRASCLIQSRHVGDGVRYATDVLDALPVERHDQLLYEVARRVVAVVPHEENRRPECDDLRDRLVVLPGR
jgi:transcriptional regulator with XRE-family HTH domain